MMNKKWVHITYSLSMPLKVTFKVKIRAHGEMVIAEFLLTLRLMYFLHVNRTRDKRVRHSFNVTK